MADTISKSELTVDKLAYTPDEAARALGISVRSIFKEIQAQRLEARKPYPTKTLIPADSLRAWLSKLPTRDAVAAYPDAALHPSLNAETRRSGRAARS